MLTSAPALEPVTLADVKSHLASIRKTRLHDTLLSCLITAARIVCEARTGLVLSAANLDACVLETWPANGDRVPFAVSHRFAGWCRFTCAMKTGGANVWTRRTYRGWRATATPSTCTTRTTMLRAARKSCEPQKRAALKLDVAGGPGGPAGGSSCCDQKRHSRTGRALVHATPTAVSFGDQTVSGPGPDCSGSAAMLPREMPMPCRPESGLMFRCTQAAGLGGRGRPV